MKILTAGDFTRIGKDGIGNLKSKVAQTLCLFHDKLYIGVTHHHGHGPDDRARILCHDPSTGSWETVYESPLVPADDLVSPARDLSKPQRFGNSARDDVADLVPLNRGYRGMGVFQATHESEPALYVSTLSHWGACLLRSTDGRKFDLVSEPGFGDATILSFRSFVPYKNKLFLARTGTVTPEKLDRNFSDRAMIFVSADPASGNWKEAMSPGFGDPGNRAIFAMTEFAGHLYAGTGNAERGFQIWKTTAEGEPPYTWHPVVVDGAGRYNVNEFALTMATFRDALYVGSGLPGFGFDKEHNAGPGAAELIRIREDDSWELVMGSPRFSQHGLQIPTSALGPGFEDAFNSVVWSMAEHDGCFYVGTNNWRPFHCAFSGEQEMKGGFHLWGTEDGDDWYPITSDGFGNPFSCGVRTLLSTPFGFFLGTSSHQEIEPFWRRRSGQRGEAGTSAMEVWLAP